MLQIHFISILPEQQARSLNQKYIAIVSKHTQIQALIFAYCSNSNGIDDVSDSYYGSLDEESA